MTEEGHMMTREEVRWALWDAADNATETGIEPERAAYWRGQFDGLAKTLLGRGDFPVIWI
jgi:hypothetical protein